MHNTGLSPCLTREEFVRHIEESQLLSALEIDNALKECASAARDGDGMGLGRALVSAGILTGYQMEAVYHRRFQELRIGNYEVLDRLGQGGMGTVFKARHRRMKRLVAIKVLLRSLCQESSFIQRFQREVETVARLSHPNVVIAHDADEAEVGHFLVMEFVNGRDLDSSVQKQGPFPVRTAVNCVLQAARGLEYAHQQGIIHRDIKPANLLLEVSGVVKIADLGLARLNSVVDHAGLTSSGLTQAGGILGTVDYMSPEQAVDSTSIDPRADIYSLGCTLYFLLTGQPLYSGASFMKVLLKHRDAPIPALATSRPECPTTIDDLFRKMVAKAPADRPPSMTEVVKALEAMEAALGGPLGLPAPGLQVDVGPVVPTRPASAPEYSQTVDLRPFSTQHGGQLSLLLVEPSRTQATIIRKYLEGLGLQPAATVTSGQSALEEVRKSPPHVIVSAMHLKDMTGVQLAQQVQAEQGSTALGFVLISSESESRDAGSLSKVANAALLHKPFSLEQLADALNLVSHRKLQPLPGAVAASERALSRPGMLGTRTLVPVPPVPPSGRDRLKVLLADDSSAARSHVRGVLRSLGLTQLVEVADGAQAVAAVAREMFDLVVTDYNMPCIDGQGLVGFLRQYSPSASVPVLVVTTETDPGKLDALRRLGVTAICDKSFQLEVVKEIVDRLFP